MQNVTQMKRARLTVNLSTVEKRRARRVAKADGRTLSNWALAQINRAVELSEQHARETEGGAS